MNYAEAEKNVIRIPGVEKSTLMKVPCLRYYGDFFAMYYRKADGMVIKVSEERAKELIALKKAAPFNITKKQFKEWVIIPKSFEKDYNSFIFEALEFVKSKNEIQ